MKQGSYLETVEVRVRVSPQAAAILRRDAVMQKGTIATLAGRMLTDAVLAMDNAKKIKEAEARFGAIKGESRTVLELSKSHTAQQISAMLHMPYRAVMSELGKGIDSIASRDAEDMPSTYGSQP